MCYIKKKKHSGSFIVFKGKASTSDRCKFLSQPYHLTVYMDLGMWGKWSDS